MILHHKNLEGLYKLERCFLVRKNLVFITTDHQRADTIGMIQNGREVTPNLNRLALEGVDFKRAYTTCPLCVPARTSLATGCFPTRNRVVINDLKNIPDITRDSKTIHQYLFENGYSVSHFGMQHITVKPPLEERVKFKEFLTDDDYEKICKREGLPLFGVTEDRVRVSERHGDIYEDREYTGSRVSLFEREESLFRDRFYIDRALKYLDSETFEKPIGLFINIWAPHPPFKVLKGLMERFPNPELPENINKICEGEPSKRREGIAAQLAEERDLKHWKDVWKAYLGLTNYADELIGEIIEKLREKGEYENTIFVFTADHGDHLGQHKMFQKMEMYEQSINIPLIIKEPGKKGKRVDTVVSHLDILPTVLDILEIKSDRSFVGENILKSEVQNKDRFAYSQYSGNQVAIGDIRRAIISKDFKYVYDPRDSEELFNLRVDPLEMKNLEGRPEYKEIKRGLKNQMSLFLKEQNDWIHII